MSIVKYFSAKLGKSNHDPAPVKFIFLFSDFVLFVHFDTSNSRAASLLVFSLKCQLFFMSVMTLHDNLHLSHQRCTERKFLSCCTFCKRQLFFFFFTYNLLREEMLNLQLPLLFFSVDNQSIFLSSSCNWCMRQNRANHIKCDYSCRQTPQLLISLIGVVDEINACIPTFNCC